MSLRYGIFIRSDCWGDRRLVIHELAHTKQYERLGSLWHFLKLYLFECLASPAIPSALRTGSQQIEQDLRI